MQFTDIDSISVMILHNLYPYHLIITKLSIGEFFHDKYGNFYCDMRLINPTARETVSRPRHTFGEYANKNIKCIYQYSQFIKSLVIKSPPCIEPIQYGAVWYHSVRRKTRQFGTIFRVKYVNL